MRRRDLKNLIQNRGVGGKESPEWLEQSCCQTRGLAAFVASRPFCILGDGGRQEFCTGRSRRAPGRGGIQPPTKEALWAAQAVPRRLQPRQCLEGLFFAGSSAKSRETTRIQQPPPCSLPLLNRRRKQEETAKLLQPLSARTAASWDAGAGPFSCIPRCRARRGVSDPVRRGDSLSCSSRSGSCSQPAPAPSGSFLLNKGGNVLPDK